MSFGLQNYNSPGTGLFAIHKLFRCGVPENNVSDLVERGFMRESGKRIHRNLAAQSEALNVSVQLVEGRTRDVQRDYREYGTKRLVARMTDCLVDRKTA